MRRVAAAATVAAALLAAGCGSGSRSGGLPGGAAQAPADAAALVALRTDPHSAQWKQALALARRFPALRAQLSKLDAYKDAVGPELDLVWLDLANGGGDVVGLTKPRALAQLKTLVQPNGTSYARLSGGWVAIAAGRSLLDRFEQRAKGDKLDRDASFEDAFGKLDRHAALRAWARGPTVQGALDASLARSGAAPRITHDAGDLRALVASARAVGGGVAFEAHGLIDPAPKPATFTPSLQASVPAGALLYVATAGLDRPTRLILRMVGDSKPSFDAQLARVESVLNISLANDVYPLLEGESALAVYPQRRVPRLLFVQKVDDSTKADGLLRRFSAVVQLAGSGGATTEQLGGTTVQKLTFKGSSQTVYDGVAKGRIFVTNDVGLAGQAVATPTTPLGSDRRFRQARSAAHVPGKVAALVYGDLAQGLPYVFELAGGAAAAATANTKPLAATAAYLVPEGDGLKLSGFTAIK